MSEQDTLVLDAATGAWWERPEYSTGEIELPGQSRLSADNRKVLEAIAVAAEKGKIEIPPMPRAAMEAARVLRQADPDPNDLAKCIELDPAMSAWMLKHANSALYGARVPIDTVARAVTHLGMRRLKAVILELSMRRMGDKVSAAAWSAREWNYSIAAACIARALGKFAGLDEDMCYLAGLLHDIGRLPALMELDIRKVLPIEPKPDSAVDIIAECLHRALGVQVAKLWELPPAVHDAIALHLTGRHADEESSAKFPSTKVADAASDLCLALGIGRDRRNFDVLSTPSLLAIGFTRDSLAKWLANDLPKVMAQVRELGSGR